MNNLKKDLSNNIVKNCYLFYGKEHFLIDFYKNKIIDQALSDNFKEMNLNIYNDNFLVSSLIDNIETLPFFDEKRLVIVSKSNLFTTKRKDDAEMLIKTINNQVSHCIIIFIEDEIDKRNKLYKTVSKTAQVVEFKPLNNKNLSQWVSQLLNKYGMTIDYDACELLLQSTAFDMLLIENEVNKLMAYKNYENKIVLDDVLKIVSLNSELKIFELMNAIGNKKVSKALSIYKNFLDNKESPIMILFMITRQFKMMYLCSDLKAKGASDSTICEKLKIRDFMLREALKQAKNFNLDTLNNAYKDCLETDNNIKTGKMAQNMAVEMLIIKYSKTAV